MLGIGNGWLSFLRSLIMAVEVVVEAMLLILGLASVGYGRVE